LCSLPLDRFARRWSLHRPRLEESTECCAANVRLIDYHANRHLLAEQALGASGAASERSRDAHGRLSVGRRNRKRSHRVFHVEEIAPAAVEAQRPASFSCAMLFATQFLTRLGQVGCDAWTLLGAGHSLISVSARYVHSIEDVVMNVFVASNAARGSPGPRNWPGCVALSPAKGRSPCGKLSRDAPTS